MIELLAVNDQEKEKINHKNWKKRLDIKKIEDNYYSKFRIFSTFEILNNILAFSKQVKKFVRDQKWRNKNVSQNISRDKKTDEEMGAWLENKKVASKYIFCETNWFLKYKMNDSRNEIQNLYTRSFNSILKVNDIPKENIILAFVHFNESHPKLIFYISNLKTKYHKTLEKEIVSVNTCEFNPTRIMKNKMNESIKNNYGTKKHIGFYKELIDDINSKYKKNVLSYIK